MNYFQFMETGLSKTERDNRDLMIYDQPFIVRTTEIDRNMGMTIPAVIQLMQESSMRQIIDMKASYWDLQEEGISWVLLKKEVRFYKWPQLRDRVIARTYASEFDRFFAYRDYILLDEQNQVYAEASSQWSLLDIKKRKMARMHPRFLELPTPDVSLEKPSFKLKPLESYDGKKEFPTDYFDLDWNQHLNNGVLIRKILSVLDAESLVTPPSKFQISFKSEVFIDQPIQIEWKKENDQAFFRITNLTTSKDVALATLYW